MATLKLSRIKLYNFMNINNTEWVGIRQINTIVGKNEESKRKLLSLFESVNLFSSLNDKKIIFSCEKNIKEVELILEFELDKAFQREISGLLNDKDFKPKDKLVISKTKTGYYYLDVLENLIEENLSDLQKINMISLFKESIPKFEEIKAYKFDKSQYLKNKKDRILLCYNLEKYCIETNKSVVQYCKENFGNSIVIHFTTPPFIVSNTQTDISVVDMDKRFVEVKIQTNLEHFDRSLKIMAIGMILSLIIAIFWYARLYYVNKNDSLLDSLHNTFTRWGKDVLIVFIIFVFLTIIFSAISKKSKYHDDIMGVMVSPLMAGVSFILVVAPVGIIAMNILLTILLTYLVFLPSYMPISKLLLSSLFLVIDFATQHTSEINFEIENVISKKEFFPYMITLVSASIMPYMIGISRLLVKKLFGLANKPLVDYSQNLVDKVLNIKTIRLVLYFFAFWLYFANIVLKVKGFEIIREGMLTWIILDTLSFSVFAFFENKKNKKIKRERLEFQKSLMPFFNDSILEKNKFQIDCHFSEMEAKEGINQYFETSKDRTKKSKMKQKKHIQEYYSDFFYRYSRFKNQSIMSREEYKSIIESLKTLLEAKEIQILSS